MAATTKKHNSHKANSFGHFGLESLLQQHIRRLHEDQSRRNIDEEPARGKDPWLGLMA